MCRGDCECYFNQQGKRGIDMSEESPQSLGGKARAQKLTHNEKVAIARQGGNKRDDVLSDAKKHKIAVQGGKASQES